MARAPRIEQVAQERRRRAAGTLDRMQHLRLAVPEQVQKDNPGYAFRWVNDHGNRMDALTVRDDWDKVSGVEPIPVDTRDGKPVYAHLCMKRQEYWEADQREKTDAIAQAERGVLKGENKEAPETAYAVEGNRISSGYTP